MQSSVTRSCFPSHSLGKAVLRQQKKIAHSFFCIKGWHSVFGILKDGLAGVTHCHSQQLTSHLFYTLYTFRYEWLLGLGAGSICMNCCCVGIASPDLSQKVTSIVKSSESPVCPLNELQTFHNSGCYKREEKQKSSGLMLLYWVLHHILL